MSSPDRPRYFADALSGPDGTQAPTIRYVPPPSYPDASLGVRPRRPGRRPEPSVSGPRLPPVAVDPEPPAAAPTVPERAQAVPPPSRQARRTSVLAPGAVPSAPYVKPAAPSRQVAARSTYYQGRAPIAVAPAAASLHNQPMTYAPQQQQIVFQPPGTASPRPPAPLRPVGSSAPFAGPAAAARPVAPAPPIPVALRYHRPQRARTRRRAGWVQGLLALILLGLIGSGLGERLLDWLRLVLGY